MYNRIIYSVAYSVSACSNSSLKLFNVYNMKYSNGNTLDVLCIISYTFKFITSEINWNMKSTFSLWNVIEKNNVVAINGNILVKYV